jgi:hypothetical protein
VQGAEGKTEQQLPSLARRPFVLAWRLAVFCPVSWFVSCDASCTNQWIQLCRSERAEESVSCQHGPVLFDTVFSASSSGYRHTPTMGARMRIPSALQE